MFTLWRKLVVWLRTLLLKLSKKEKIKWTDSLSELLTIIANMLTKQTETQEPIKPIKPIKPVKPIIPDYTIIPTPRKRLLDWLFRR
jgi:hypothetical protein